MLVHRVRCNLLPCHPEDQALQRVTATPRPVDRGGRIQYDRDVSPILAARVHCDSGRLEPAIHDG